MRTIIVDPSAVSFIATIRSKGRFYVRKGRNSVLSGIRNVATMLNSGKLVFSEACEERSRNSTATYGMSERWSEEKMFRSSRMIMRWTRHGT